MRNYRILQVAAAFAALAIIVPLDSKQAKADDNAVAEAWILAWNSLDPNAVVAIFTEDAFYEDVPSGQKYRGRAELHAFAKAVFDSLPDIHLDLVNSELQGGHGTIEWIFSGTDQGTGKKFSVRGVSVIDVQGYSISRNSDYFDNATILRQTGQLPPE